MKIVGLFISIFISTFLNAQTTPEKKCDNCADLMEEFSYFWKNDSLGLNGFRLQVFDRISNCNGKFTSDFLLTMLGAPNTFSQDRLGDRQFKYYGYYVFDGRKVPPNNLTYELIRLVFTFDEKTNTLLSMYITPH